MPEHNLEPPRFARRSLERILGDWPAVKAMIMTGSPTSSNDADAHAPADVMFEDDVYLSSQHGTQRLDKFVHTLIVKCNAVMLDALLVTLIREMRNEQVPGRSVEARDVTRRFMRSVVRIFVVLSVELTPQTKPAKG